MTPHQLILELIEEALNAGEKDAGGTPASQEFKEWALDEIEEELKAVKPFPMVGVSG
jgi:hypothetical protein